jgi:hypothetical protein
MLVTADRRTGETSLHARKRIYEALLIDSTFVGDVGRFGSPLADWFVIGGRWSGHLLDMQQAPRPDASEEFGAEADAIILTQQHFDRFLAGFQDYIHLEGSHCHFLDLDGDACNPSFVDRKWITVVDYHQ